MPELQWVKFSPADWLTGTRGLSAAETGVYITLIMMMYEAGGPIRQTEMLHRKCGATPSTFSTILSMLITTGKIQVVEGGLFNGRAAIEISASFERVKKAKQAAKTGWEKREVNQWSSDALAFNTTATRAGTTLHNNTLEEERKTHVPSGTRSRKSNGFDQETYAEFEEVVWGDFPRHPNSRKEPAFKAYEKLEMPERIKCITGVMRYRERFQSTKDPKLSDVERLRFVPHLVTWINQKGWESEIERSDRELFSSAP